MRDLKCDPKTFVGPVDPRVAKGLEKRFRLDTDWLACLETCHGASPATCEFHVQQKRCQVALFLTLLDEDSNLKPPFRPHFDDPEMDERVASSVSFVLDHEHATSQALFSGLLPFAATQADMCLDRAYVDLICFDCRTPVDKPPVVLWKADEAQAAYLAWEELPFSQQFDEDEQMTSIPWDDFLVPVAANFAAFIEMLAEPKA